MTNHTKLPATNIAIFSDIESCSQGSPLTFATSALTQPQTQTLTKTKAENLCSVRVQPPWAFDLFVRAGRIAALPDGWDGPQSVQIGRAIISKAENLIQYALLSARRPTAPYLVPGGDGSLQIEWHTKVGEIELDLSPNGEVSLWGRSDSWGAEFEAEDDKALELFARWATQIADTLENDQNASTSSNSSLFGSEATLSIYQDDTIS